MALKRDCDSLADKHKDDSHAFQWLRGDTNSLPPAIAALKPKVVEFYPSKVLQQLGGEGGKWFGSTAVVRITIFGFHSTGRRGQAWLGLDVLCEPEVSNYSPDRMRSSTPLRYWQYRKVADAIYEFY